MDYDFLVKRRARKELRKFIEKNLTKDRSELRVLCFPGAEALEILEVYDLLGVARKNIVALEANPEIFEALRAKNLGCDLRLSTFSTFVETNINNKFDIVSLDFMGRLESNAADISNLIGRKNIAKDCVIYTNFCTGREGKGEKEFYEHLIYLMEVPFFKTSPFPSGWCDFSSKEWSDVLAKRDEELAELKIKISGRPLDDNRSFGISLCTAFAILFAEMFYSETDTVSLETMIESFATEEEKIAIFPGYLKIAEEKRQSGARFILTIHNFIRRYKRHIADNVPYSYTNAKGTRMYSDMFFLSENKIINGLKRFYGDEVFEKKSLYQRSVWQRLPLEERNKREDSWIKSVHDWCRLPSQKDLRVSIFRKRIEAAFPVTFLTSRLRTQRTHFGNESSYRMTPFQAKKFVQKNASLSTKELAKETGQSIGRIAAWKAHVTMGTYKKISGDK